MNAKQIIGVRYCGGCNPRYDRVTLVKRLQAALPQAKLVPAQDGVPYDAIIAVHGCPARCTGFVGLAVPESRRVALYGEAELPSAQKQLEQLLASE